MKKRRLASQSLEREVRACLEAHSPSIGPQTLMSDSATEQSMEALESLSLGVMQV